MYVHWIHGDAPVPEWWKKLTESLDSLDEGESPWLARLERRWAEDEALLDAMEPLPPLDAGWRGYDVDALPETIE